MNPTTNLQYDGSFDGFLSCVFVVYEQKISTPTIQKEFQNTADFFATTETVFTDAKRAKRVWKAFCKKTTSKEQKDVFKVFLSEIKGVENTLLRYMQHTFKNAPSKDIDFSNKDILKISQVARMVDREKHRMEAFVRFQLTTDQIYVSTVEPDFNVLPLIINHFKDRYADQKWLIFDMKRKYGIFYDLISVDTITFEDKEDHILKKISDNYDDKESEFQQLWDTYYKNVNIKSRKNTKLHLQHLPKRYWKYLTEKKPL